MHLSSRLPKKNYDNSLDGEMLSGRKSGEMAVNSKIHYHNTVGPKNPIIKNEESRIEKPLPAYRGQNPVDISEN